MRKLLDVQYLLWLALILALAGSLKHLAAIFASIDGNIAFGWLQAVAIDAGLFALAYSIKVRKVAKRTVKPLWFGVILFSGISIYGNLAYGLLATDGNLPAWIVTTQPYILAASLPVLVLFLAELISDDRQHMARVAVLAAKREEREAAKRRDAVELPAANGNLATVNNDRFAAKVAKQQELVAIYRQQPGATITELAGKLNVSRGTIRNYGKELGIEFATNGRNGHRSS
jgi:hypothetical protein